MPRLEHRFEVPGSLDEVVPLLRNEGYEGRPHDMTGAHLSIGRFLSAHPLHWAHELKLKPEGSGLQVEIEIFHLWWEKGNARHHAHMVEQFITHRLQGQPLAVGTMDSSSVHGIFRSLWGKVFTLWMSLFFGALGAWVFGARLCGQALQDLHDRRDYVHGMDLGLDWMLNRLQDYQAGARFVWEPGFLWALILGFVLSLMPALLLQASESWRKAEFLARWWVWTQGSAVLSFFYIVFDFNFFLAASAALVGSAVMLGHRLARGCRRAVIHHQKPRRLLITTCFMLPLLLAAVGGHHLLRGPFDFAAVRDHFMFSGVGNHIREFYYKHCFVALHAVDHPLDRRPLLALLPTQDESKHIPLFKEGFVVAGYRHLFKEIEGQEPDMVNGFSKSWRTFLGYLIATQAPYDIVILDGLYAIDEQIFLDEKPFRQVIAQAKTSVTLGEAYRKDRFFVMYPNKIYDFKGQFMAKDLPGLVKALKEDDRWLPHGDFHHFLKAGVSLNRLGGAGLCLLMVVFSVMVLLSMPWGPGGWLRRFSGPVLVLLMLWQGADLSAWVKTGGHHAQVVDGALAKVQGINRILQQIFSFERVSKLNRQADMPPDQGGALITVPDPVFTKQREELTAEITANMAALIETMQEFAQLMPEIMNQQDARLQYQAIRLCQEYTNLWNAGNFGQYLDQYKKRQSLPLPEQLFLSMAQNSQSLLADQNNMIDPRIRYYQITFMKDLSRYAIDRPSLPWDNRFWLNVFLAAIHDSLFNVRYQAYRALRSLLDHMTKEEQAFLAHQCEDLLAKENISYANILLEELYFRLHVVLRFSTYQTPENAPTWTRHTGTVTLDGTDS